ncbi:hypothetical protein [Winogradskyella ludwigii]|uniref:hypothetical protein n=1 Tax=Winogradskyella ludwigii TaxID=2686076 RepID=UPI0015CDDF49|nr:hypothetical protein [Winogradskyella ludwigii]
MTKSVQKGNGNQQSSGNYSPNIKGKKNQTSFGDNSPNAKKSKINQKLNTKEKLSWLTGGIILPVVAGLIIELVKEGMVSDTLGIILAIFN